MLCPHLTSQENHQDRGVNSTRGSEALLMLFGIFFLIFRQVAKMTLSSTGVIRPYYCLLYPDVENFKRPRGVILMSDTKPYFPLQILSLNYSR